MSNKSRPSLDFVARDYCLALQAAGRAEATLTEKRHRLQIFLGWLADQSQSPGCPAELTAEHYRQFMAYLQSVHYGDHHPTIRSRNNRPLSPYTIRAYARVVKGWSRWMVAEGYLEVDPLRNDRMPREPQRQVQPFTDAEVERIIGAIDLKRFPAAGWRQLALVLFLLDTGLRLGELVSLEDRHLWLDQQRCLVEGKGNKQRYVPFGVTCRRYLMRYMEVYRPEPLGEPAYVFRAPDGGQLSADRVGQILRGLGQKAGVEEVRAHRFRHTFGYRYIRNGGDVFSLMRILGHATVKSTMIYVTLQDEDVQEKHRQFSPVDRIRKLPRFRG